MSTGSLKSRIQHYFITKLIRELSINVKVSPGSVSIIVACKSQQERSEEMHDTEARLRGCRLF